MKSKYQIKKELEEEIVKTKYRIEILNLIEEKLNEMKILAQVAAGEELLDEDRKNINKKVKSLQEQVNLLNVESNGIS